MAQYDVYANPSAAQRDGFPYVVVMQSDQLDHYSSRFVMPLARLPRRPEKAPRRLVQALEIEGEILYLAAHMCAALPAQLLKNPTTHLQAERQLFIDALDAVVSGI
jgi:toxin CcdB